MRTARITTWYPGGNRPPAIHSRTGRMMSCAIVDDRVVEPERPNQ
jgi:hypothetical protein